jgi:uncharacterized peroxidase-related enzyme
VTGAPDTVVRAVQTDWREAELEETDRAICAYVEKLTRTPGAMTAGDLDPLRAAGLEDDAIHDVCAVTSYFAYMNRIADGLGVDLEAEMDRTPPWE